MPSCSDERRARAYLQHALEPASPQIARLVADLGPVDAARSVDDGTAPRDVLQTRRTKGGTWADTNASLQFAADNDIRFVTPEDDEWPAERLAALSGLPNADSQFSSVPLGLWVRGKRRLDELAARSVSVIGARASTEYGEHHAAEIAYDLAVKEVVVWSGAAYGIDGAAHRGALAAPGGNTVAVLGSGIAAGYPAGHIALLKRISWEGGAVVSEYPPQRVPARQQFLDRNRLLAALTQATVLIEAGRRSGAGNCARRAAALDRPVMALPGAASSNLSWGCHELVKLGIARLATSATDILAALDTRDDA